MGRELTSDDSWSRVQGGGEAGVLGGAEAGVLAEREARGARGTAPVSWRARLRGIEPELLSGASDNDPTTIGTALAVGSRSVYALSWVALLVAPMLAVVLTIAAQVGAVARGDVQTLAVARYGRRVGGVLALSVVVVNVVTIAADLQAGAAGIGLLADADPRWLVVPLGVALMGLLVLGGYDEVVTVLRYVLLGFAAFGLAAVLAGPDWLAVLRCSLAPSVSLRGAGAVGGLALLGTTLTSYVYVWETIGRSSGEEMGRRAGSDVLARARSGAWMSAVLTALVLWFVLVAAAATLGRHHSSITSVQEGARALRPLAGPLSSDLFALGLVASAVVALPVLMATTAHVMGAQFDWRRGLSEPPRHARAFYATLTASLALGLAAALAHVSVFGMLIAASVIGGIGAPLGLIVLIRLARDTAVMGDQRISRRLAAGGWAVTVLIGGAGLLFLIAGATGGL